MKDSKTLAIALESVGISAIIGGIVIEVILRAPIGFIIITTGSLIVTAGGLLWTKIIRRNE